MKRHIQKYARMMTLRLHQPVFVKNNLEYSCAEEKIFTIKMIEYMHIGMTSME